MNQPTKQITVPQYQEQFYKHEHELLACKSQYMVNVAHRRSRKTTHLLNRALLEAVTGIPGMVYLVFPSATLARDAIWSEPTQIRRVIPDDLILKRNEQEMTIHLKPVGEQKTGSLIAIRGSDSASIDRLTGTSGKCYLLDEFQIMSPTVFDRVIYPIVSQNKGKCIISGTPRGKGRFYELFKRGDDPDYPNWKSFLYPADKTEVFTSKELEAIKSSMPERLFQSEYMCSWTESEGVVFKNVRDFCILNPTKPIKGHYYKIGVDLARLSDYSCVSVFDSGTNKQVYIERWKTLDWTAQASKIKAMAKFYNNALCIVEANSIGDVVIDLLTRSGVAVLPFHTTNTSKKQIVEKLALYIESNKIKLLNDPLLIDEMENFGYSMSDFGNVRYKANSGHDDMVLATCFVANQLFPLYKDVPLPPEPTPIQRAYKKLSRVYEAGDDIDFLEDWGASG